MEGRTFEGKDLDEAIANASAELSIPADDLHYEIVEQGRRGVLGFGARSVQIRVKPPLDGVQPKSERRPTRQRSNDRQRKKPDGAAPRKPAPPTEVSAQAEPVVATVQKMVDLMGFEVVARPIGGDGVTIALDGADCKRLVARKGEVLSALQFLLNRMARRAWPDVRRVTLECDGRSGGRRRDDDLVRRIREMAEKVVESGKTRRTEPMNSYERRLVHLTVRELPGLSSSSEGGGATKRVRISKVRNSIE